MPPADSLPAPADSLPARADSLPAPADSLPALADSAAGAPPPDFPLVGIVEAASARGWDVEMHGVSGFDLGHLDRVDGWTPSFGLTLLSVRPNALPTVDLTAGWRSNRPRRPFGRIAVTQIFAGADRLRVAAEAYRATHTTDAWKVGARENDLSVFFFRTDLRNYYEANGVRVSAASSDLRAVGATLTLIAEQNRGLQQDGFFTASTLLGDDEDFRPNPLVPDARVTAAVLEARLVTASTQSPSLRVPGWNVAVELERAFDALGADVTFWRGRLDLRRYTRLAARHWVNARLHLEGPVLGTEELPRPRFTYLGGPGSLPGYDSLVLGGDRGVLASAEYTFSLPNTSWSTPVFLLWQLEVFSNAGNAVPAAERTRLWSDLHWDAGVGVSGVTVLGNLGLYVAQRLSHMDERHDGPRVFARLARAF